MPHDGHDFTEPPPDPALRVKALESLLVEKGLVDPAALDLLIDTYEHKVGPRNGARVIARAWVGKEFKRAIKEDCSAVIKKEYGFEGRQGEHIVAVENTPEVHNVVVCTLCSCYPWTVLGLPPVWYKSAPYRSRVEQDPRGVLQDFGTGIRTPRCATSSSPSAPPAPTAGARNAWPNWSRAIPWSASRKRRSPAR